MTTEAKTRWDFQYKDSLEDIFASPVIDFSFKQDTKNSIVEILANKANKEDIQVFISSLEHCTRSFIENYNEDRKNAKLKAENSWRQIEPSYTEIKATMEDLSDDIENLTTKLALIENHPLGIALKTIQKSNNKQPIKKTIQKAIDSLDELSWLSKEAINNLAKDIKRGRHSKSTNEDYFRCVAVLWRMKLGFLPTTTENGMYCKIMEHCYQAIGQSFPTNYKKFISAGVKNAKIINERKNNELPLINIRGRK